MAPFFAFLCIIVFSGAMIVCSFLFFRISHPGGSALIRAFAFTGGAVLGLVAGVLSATLVVGTDPTLKTVTGMNLYFSWLGACSLFGGLALVKALPLVLRRFRTVLADPHEPEADLAANEADAVPHAQQPPQPQ